MQYFKEILLGFEESFNNSPVTFGHLLLSPGFMLWPAITDQPELCHRELSIIFDPDFHLANMNFLISKYLHRWPIFFSFLGEFNYWLIFYFSIAAPSLYFWETNLHRSSKMISSSATSEIFCWSVVQEKSYT